MDCSQKLKDRASQSVNLGRVQVADETGLGSHFVVEKYGRGPAAAREWPVLSEQRVVGRISWGCHGVHLARRRALHKGRSEVTRNDRAALSQDNRIASQLVDVARVDVERAAAAVEALTGDR